MSTPQSNRKTDRTVIKSEGRAIIAKVYDFMKKEATQNHAERITDAVWRTAQASGISKTTVKRILKERRTRPSPTNFTSIKNRTVKDRITLDDFETDTANTNPHSKCGDYGNISPIYLGEAYVQHLEVGNSIFIPKCTDE